MSDKVVLQGAQSYCIDLPDDDPTDVRTMLEYLYKLDYAQKARNEYFDALAPGKRTNLTVDTDKIRRLSSFQLVCNVSMYCMGEKYGVHGLKGIASENVAAVFTNPDRLVDGKWVSNIDVGALCTAIQRIYDITPDLDKHLRDQVLRYVRLYLKRLLPQEDFKAVLAKIPEFSYELLVQEAENRPSEEAETKKRKRDSKRADDLSIESPQLVA